MNPSYSKWLVILAFSLWVTILQGQNHPDTSFVKVMFYNFENLFDPEDDSLTNDDEFTPTGSRYYTKTKMYRKINNIARVVLAVGKGRMPGIVGACEVENRKVLEKLVRYSALQKFGYKIVHFDSPDSRGIDVALLYRPESYRVVYSRPVAVSYDSSGLRRTRDILYTKGVLAGGDTLHVFVNHWPSRYGGVQSTIERRMQVAGVLRRLTDSVCSLEPGSMVLIMGDLNDDPDDPSVKETLGAVFPESNLVGDECRLVNLMWECLKPGSEGTLKHQNRWNVFDQMLVPSAMINGRSRWQVRGGKANVLRDEFLFEPDETWGGRKLFRTYVGLKYSGGYSDHLPVYLDLIRQ
ncbi:MAG: endonuclease [Bacteroidales bacterium]|nr:endonuclease [Bacteroidales bacterium]MDD3665098.1 endonuclease [Bacteroidales bacterium]